MAAFELAGANQSTFTNEDVAAITGDRFVMAGLLNEADFFPPSGIDFQTSFIYVTVKDPFGNDLESVSVASVRGAPGFGGPPGSGTGIFSDVELHGRAGGGFAATWVYQGDVFFRAFDANFLPETDAVTVYDAPVGFEGDAPRLTEKANGEFAVTFTAASTTGGGNSTAFSVVNPDTGVATLITAFGNTQQSDIATLANGNFVYSHQNDTGADAEIVMTIFNGATNVQITSFTNTFSSDQSEARLTALSNGNFVVVYTDDLGGDDVYFRIYGPTGIPVDSNTPTNFSGSEAQPAITATHDGGFLIAVRSANNSGDIVVLKYDATGSVDGLPLTINSPVAGDQSMPELTLLEDGRVVAVWMDGTRGAFQILDDRPANIIGDPTNNVIVGHDTGLTAVNDVIQGLGGNDTVYGLGGNDYFYLGEGNDIGVGGAGIDVLLGEGGNDTLYGGADQDYFFGGTGTNIMVGEGGVDVFNSMSAGDIMYGGTEGDYFYTTAAPGTTTSFGEAGNDILVGGNAGEIFYGGEGQDYLYGFGGNDTFFGGAGVDVFLGGNGNDTFEGGKGIDYGFGGAGSDTFVVRAGDGVDVLQDFQTGIDKVNFVGVAGLSNFADVQANSFFASGINTTIVTGDDGTAAWLVGVSVLSASDFTFG